MDAKSKDITTYKQNTLKCLICQNNPSKLWPKKLLNLFKGKHKYKTKKCIYKFLNGNIYFVFCLQIATKVRREL